MKFTFENQGTNTFLVYTVAADDVIDTMSLGMLTNNKILGIAPTQFTQMDTTKYIKYNISAHISVTQFFAGSVNKKRLVGVFKGIVNAMISAEEYMIDTRSLFLNTDYIFADVSSCEAVMICLPITEVEEHQADMGSFFKNIMFSTQFDSTENCDYVAKIINYLNSTPRFSLTDFKEILDEIDNGKKAEPEAPKAQPVVTQPKVTQKPVEAQPTHIPTNNGQPLQVKPQGTVVAPPTTQAPTATVPKVPTPPKMAVPNAPKSAAPAAPATPAATPEKEISWFYLMQHYNKENAAAYKAQKEAKKKGGSPAPKTTPVKTQVPPTPPRNANPGYAFPGQATPINTPVAVPPAQAQNNPPAVSVPQSQPVQAQPVQAHPTYVPRQAPQGQAMNFGETTVLGGGAIGETTVLSAAQNPNKIIAPHLIRKKNNEKISVNKPVFRIGKERSYVDYFVGDNTAISRSHANIITREGQYFIVDTNSTNHTFVNGNMIQSNEEIAIDHGDVIRLANEDFDFRLY